MSLRSFSSTPSEPLSVSSTLPSFARGSSPGWSIRQGPVRPRARAPRRPRRPTPLPCPVPFARRQPCEPCVIPAVVYHHFGIKVAVATGADLELRGAVLAPVGPPPWTLSTRMTSRSRTWARSPAVISTLPISARIHVFTAESLPDVHRRIAGPPQAMQHRGVGRRVRRRQHRRGNEDAHVAGMAAERRLELHHRQVPLVADELHRVFKAAGRRPRGRQARQRRVDVRRQRLQASRR